MSFSTLVDLLRFRSRRQPERRAYTYLVDGETEETVLTYAELDRKARAIAASLQSLCAPGERVLLVYPSGLDYIAAFFGCLYAGMVAVPVYPPRPNRSLLRLQTVLADVDARMALTTSPLLSKVERALSLNSNLSSMKWLDSDGIEPAAAGEWQAPTIESNTLAFIQYTSGSTSAPKGVMVSHGNLMHNQRLIEHAFHQTDQSVIIGWLPLYHDMGLIGNVLQSLYVGAPCVLMSPVAFLQRPLRWLQAISRYRGTTSGGPNFAYELCVRKVSAEERAGLDLSSWDVAFNGSEPIRADTLERFAAAFEPCGFRRRAFSPCYGLAEATLIISGGRKTSGPLVGAFDTKALEHNRVSEVSTDREELRRLVASGAPAPEQRVLIVDPESEIECSPGHIGEIWVSSPSIAQGYWSKPQETERIFQAYIRDTGEGPFLRTGDLGFLQAGELFITGRIKDLIIIRGRNFHPQDIELSVERSHSALVAGGGAAFSVEVGDNEKLVIVQEVENHQPINAKSIIDSISQTVTEDHELQVYATVLIKKSSIPKTTSGKIQRRNCRAAFLNGSLDVVAEWRADNVEKYESPDLSASALALSSDSIESWLVSEACRILGISPSGIQTDQPISRYGLDSLAAIELSYSIESRFGVSLSIADFLSSVSIAEIGRRVLAQSRAGLTDTPHASTTPQSNEAVMEHALSRGQQALWLLHEIAPQSPAYNIASAVQIESAFDASILRHSFQALIDRHSSLRTSFTMSEGDLLQRAHEHVEGCFRIEDASTLTESAFNELLVAEAETPFDLGQAPLIRVILFSRSPSEYVMLLVVHHIVVDFWSLALMVRELGLIYTAAENGVEADLAPLDLQYGDYVRRQNEMLSGPEGERLWNYWKNQLAGELSSLSLPFDRPRPPIQTFRGASQSFRLNSELAHRLKAIGSAHDATLYVTLLAAFQALLSRYTGQDTILVGSAAAGRSSAKLANIVGYFVNPVVMRADLSDAPTFEALLDRMRQTVLGAFEHQDYPFGLLVERLQPDRDPSRSPLFQVMFNLQKTPSSHDPELALFALGEADATMRLGSLSVKCKPLRQQVAQLDLTLMVAETRGGLAASLQYNTDLFDGSTIARLIGHFKTLIEGAVADPSESVSRLPLLTKAEEYQLLVSFNDTATPFSRDQCVHALFEEQSKQSPDAIAVIFEQDKLSFAELNARANQLAHHLRSLGVGPEVRVGICLDRALEMIIGMLAVLKAGGAYVPLDPTYPKERLAFILEDSQISAMLITERLTGALPEHEATVVCLDTRRAEIAQRSDANPNCGVTADNLVYVIYTSGSAGKPKGVMVSHRNVINFFAGMDQRIEADSTLTWLAVSSISFDISVLELLWTLTRGFKVVLAGGKSTPGAQIKRHKVTHLQCTPSMIKMLMTEPDSRDALRGLKKLLLGGEALSPSLAQELATELGCDIQNMYGPTETTIWSATDDVERDPTQITVGRPIANTQTYILDKQLRPLPAGLAGELYIAGEGVARGYLGHPDLTVDRFIPDPFGRQPGGRLYNTGDLSRYLSDGRIEFLGRTDQQVKVRGYRIELGEIEAAILAHAKVKEAAVTVIEHASGDKQLVACIVPNGGGNPGGSELRSFLSERLPDFMLPAFFITLDALPLTPNGKLNRRALPAHDHTRPDLKQELIPPRDTVEEAVAAIWCELLGLESIGVYDNFFELGGHSLLASQLVHRIRETFQIELPLRSFFKSPTVADLASVMLADANRRARIERIAEILISVARFSDDEVDALLDKSICTANDGNTK